MAAGKSVEFFLQFTRKYTPKYIPTYTQMYAHILLVDDDLDDRMLFEQILGETDPEIRLDCAENGLEMISWLDQCPDENLPDLVILDQIMPKMTGKESLTFLKGNPRYKDIPVIVYSTYQVNDFSFSCRELGAMDVVTKPDTMQAYRDLIGRLTIPPL
jgi:CheY-like chemotaxis protein